MTYTALVVVGVCVAVAVDLWVTNVRLVGRRAFWTAWAILLVFQLIVNGILTGLRIVRYDSSDILGLRIAYAPVEDIAFGFTIILLTLTFWVRLGRVRHDVP